MYDNAENILRCSYFLPALYENTHAICKMRTQQNHGLIQRFSGSAIYHQICVPTRSNVLHFRLAFNTDICILQE